MKLFFIGLFSFFTLTAGADQQSDTARAIFNMCEARRGQITDEGGPEFDRANSRMCITSTCSLNASASAPASASCQVSGNSIPDGCSRAIIRRCYTVSSVEDQSTVGDADGDGDRRPGVPPRPRGEGDRDSEAGEDDGTGIRVSGGPRSGRLIRGDYCYNECTRATVNPFDGDRRVSSTGSRSCRDCLARHYGVRDDRDGVIVDGIDGGRSRDRDGRDRDRDGRDRDRDGRDRDRDGRDRDRDGRDRDSGRISVDGNGDLIYVGGCDPNMSSCRRHPRDGYVYVLPAYCFEGNSFLSSCEDLCVPNRRNCEYSSRYDRCLSTDQLADLDRRRVGDCVECRAQARPGTNGWDFLSAAVGPVMGAVGIGLYADAQRDVGIANAESQEAVYAQCYASIDQYGNFVTTNQAPAITPDQQSSLMSQCRNLGFGSGSNVGGYSNMFLSGMQGPYGGMYGMNGGMYGMMAV